MDEFIYPCTRSGRVLTSVFFKKWDKSTINYLEHARDMPGDEIWELIYSIPPSHRIGVSDVLLFQFLAIITCSPMALIHHKKWQVHPECMSVWYLIGEDVETHKTIMTRFIATRLLVTIRTSRLGGMYNTYVVGELLRESFSSFVCVLSGYPNQQSIYEHDPLNIHLILGVVNMLFPRYRDYFTSNFSNTPIGMMGEAKAIHMVLQQSPLFVGNIIYRANRYGVSIICAGEPFTYTSRGGCVIYR